MMKKIASRTALTSLLVMSFACWAQMTPVGTWHSIDDQTKTARTEIVIAEQNGVLTGKIMKFLRPGADPTRVCDKCQDDRKDKLIVGMEIIRGAKKAANKDVWEGGKILDPENGSSYTLRLTPIEEGKKLEVRGSVAIFSRTQTWIRVTPPAPSTAN